MWSTSLSLFLFILFSFSFLLFQSTLLPQLLHPIPHPRLSSLSGALALPSPPLPIEECPAPPGAARPPLLPCPPTTRSDSSHLPIKAKCMLPAPDQSTFPVLSCGSPQPLSWILRAQGKVTLRRILPTRGSCWEGLLWSMDCLARADSYGCQISCSFN